MGWIPLAVRRDPPTRSLAYVRHRAPHASIMTSLVARTARLSRPDPMGQRRRFVQASQSLVEGSRDELVLMDPEGTTQATGPQRAATMAPAMEGAVALFLVVDPTDRPASYSED
jgi:hypothetical protein